MAKNTGAESSPMMEYSIFLNGSCREEQNKTQPHSVLLRLNKKKDFCLFHMESKTILKVLDLKSRRIMSQK